MPINAKECLFFDRKEDGSPCRKTIFPPTIASTLKAWDHDMYPNLYVLLRICTTIPVTSCKCEWSGSV